MVLISLVVMTTVLDDHNLFVVAVPAMMAMIIGAGITKAIAVLDNNRLRIRQCWSGDNKCRNGGNDQRKLLH